MRKKDGHLESSPRSQMRSIGTMVIGCRLPRRALQDPRSLVADDGAYSVIEIVADPRNGVPLHTHSKEQEHFIVLDGTLDIAVGDRRWDTQAGTSVKKERGRQLSGLSVLLVQAPSLALKFFQRGHFQLLGPLKLFLPAKLALLPLERDQFFFRRCHEVITRRSDQLSGHRYAHPFVIPSQHTQVEEPGKGFGFPGRVSSSPERASVAFREPNGTNPETLEIRRQRRPSDGDVC